MLIVTKQPDHDHSDLHYFMGFGRELYRSEAAHNRVK